MGKHVMWTDDERKLVVNRAVEIQLEKVGSETMLGCIALAIKELPEDRRRFVGGVSSVRDVHAAAMTALLDRQTAPTPPPVVIEIEREAALPPVQDQLAAIGDKDLLWEAVTRLAKMFPRVQPQAQCLQRPPVAAVASVSSPPPRKIRVGILGPLPEQFRHVQEKAPDGFDLVLIDGLHHSTGNSRVEWAIVWTRFCSHAWFQTLQDRLKTRLIMVGSGVGTTLKALADIKAKVGQP